MRYIFYFLQLPFLLALAVFAISNREPMELTLWPLPWEIILPGFLPILACLFIGYVLGRIHAMFSHKRPRVAPQVAPQQTPTPSASTNSKMIEAPKPD